MIFSILTSNIANNSIFRLIKKQKKSLMLFCREAVEMKYTFDQYKHTELTQ